MTFRIFLLNQKFSGLKECSSERIFSFRDVHLLFGLNVVAIISSIFIFMHSFLLSYQNNAKLQELSFLDVTFTQLVTGHL